MVRDARVPTTWAQPFVELFLCANQKAEATQSMGQQRKVGAISLGSPAHIAWKARRTREQWEHCGRNAVLENIVSGRLHCRLQAMNSLCNKGITSFCAALEVITYGYVWIDCNAKKKSADGWRIALGDSDLQFTIRLLTIKGSTNERLRQSVGWLHCDDCSFHRSCVL